MDYFVHAFIALLVETSSGDLFISSFFVGLILHQCLRSRFMFPAPQPISLKAKKKLLKDSEVVKKLED